MGQARKSWGSMCRHFVATTAKDAQDFTDALRDAYPNIRFLPEDYTRKWSETWRWAPVLNEMRDHGYWSFYPPLMRDPSGDTLIYYDSLADPRQLHYTAWVEPPGWRPEWAKDEERGSYHLVNKPKLWFEFRRGWFNYVGAPGRPPDLPREMLYWGPATDSSEPPRVDDPDKPVILTGERIFGAWDKDDKEAEAFVRKVFRILTKLTTNRFRWVDRYTRHPLPAVQGALHEWAGHDAVRWAHERRNNYLIRLNKPADYDFGDEPMASFEEVAKRDAEYRRRIDEQLEKVAGTHGYTIWENPPDE